MPNIIEVCNENYNKNLNNKTIKHIGEGVYILVESEKH